MVLMAMVKMVMMAAAGHGVIVRGGHVEQRLGIANKFVNVPFAW